MATVEFCLKSMCFMSYTHIVVRVVTPKGTHAIGGGDYAKVMRQFADKRVCRSSVADGILFIDVVPDRSSCDAFVCKKKDNCILNHCMLIDCPLCAASICSMCISKQACKM